MQVILAEPRGLCAGVERAIEIVERAIEDLRALGATVIDPGPLLDEHLSALVAALDGETVEHILGLYDYRLRIVARDLSDFERVLRRRIMTLPGAGQVEANVVLSEERLPGPLG